MDFYQSLSGMMKVELTGADIPRTLAQITGSGITLYHVQHMDEVRVRLVIRRRDAGKLQSLAEQRGDCVITLRRFGLYWWGKSLGKRPVLVAGILFFLILTLYLPSKVLFVQVEGNASIPARRILEMADQCGISFGASRREVRSEQVKNALLYALPELQWAGVNTYGCVAVISVREKTAEQKREATAGISSIVASREGIILSCTATRGTLLCRPGQAVTAGETLISAYTDCGLTIQATQAAGEVFAQTQRDLTVISPAESVHKTRTEKKYRTYSLLIGKKRINLWKDSGISDIICDRIYEEYYVTLPGEFVLPFGLALDVYTVCESRSVPVEEEETRIRMEDFARRYLGQQMVAGQIRSEMTNMTRETGILRLTGKYICTEMIGKVQWEQIGEHNGKNS